MAKRHTLLAARRAWLSYGWSAGFSACVAFRVAPFGCHLLQKAALLEKGQGPQAGLGIPL